MGVGVEGWGVGLEWGVKGGGTLSSSGIRPPADPKGPPFVLF